MAPIPKTTLREPELVWFTLANYNETRLNIENTKEIVSYWTSDSIRSEPVPNTQENWRKYIIGLTIYNMVQNDNSDTGHAIQYPGILTSSYLFNYGPMVGNLTVVTGVQQTLQQIQQSFEYQTIVSGSGVFAGVTGFIARQPYVDANGVEFQQFAAYFN